MSGAPPPSPSHAVHSSGNGDEFADYLDKLGRSLSSVNLVVPSNKNAIDRDRHRHHRRDLPVIDLSGEREKVVRRIAAAAAELGCFQVVNHGVCAHTVEKAKEECKRLFQLPLERKEEISGGIGSPFGFDDDDGTHSHSHSHSHSHTSSKHEWFWLPKNAHQIQDFLTHIWPQGCVNFSRALGDYCDALQKVSGEILDILLEGLSRSSGTAKWNKEERSHFAAEFESHDASLLCITNQKGVYKSDDQLRIKHSHPYILFLQYQTSASYNAQLFLDNAWVSIFPHPASLLVILGDVLKVWSNGKYKTVVARPVERREENEEEEEEEEDEDCTVMALMYAPSTERSISISPITQALLMQQGGSYDDLDHEKPHYTSIDLKEYASRLRRHRFVFEDPLQRYQI